MLRIHSPAAFFGLDFWFNQKHFVVRWVNIITWKSKNRKPLIFTGEG